MTSHKSKKVSFDAASLRLLEELFESTWAIVQARHPFRTFRNLEKDPDLQNDLRRKLFILAENCGLSHLDQLQRSALEAISQGND